MKKSEMLFNYLLKRFQIIPLLAIVITDMMVINRLTSTREIPFWRFFFSFVFIIIYLFHNRVADDKRDFEFDMKYYPDRDLQKGMISMDFLEKISYLMIGLMIIISALMGRLSLMFFLPLFLYTILAKKDFYFSESFKIKHLYIYNIINMLQLLFLQVFIYVSILDELILDNILLFHILLVFILSIQVEVTRKIKPTISLGNELYSDRLGMKGAILLWMFFGVASIINSTTICILLGLNIENILFYEATIFTICLFSGFIYLKNPSSFSENVFWFGLLASYIGQNIVLIYA